jgi:hypothetical protein
VWSFNVVVLIELSAQMIDVLYGFNEFRSVNECEWFLDRHDFGGAKARRRRGGRFTIFGYSIRSALQRRSSGARARNVGARCPF